MTARRKGLSETGKAAERARLAACRRRQRETAKAAGTYRRPPDRARLPWAIRGLIGEPIDPMDWSDPRSDVRVGP